MMIRTVDNDVNLEKSAIDNYELEWQTYLKTTMDCGKGLHFGKHQIVSDEQRRELLLMKWQCTFDAEAARKCIRVKWNQNKLQDANHIVLQQGSYPHLDLETMFRHRPGPDSFHVNLFLEKLADNSRILYYVWEPISAIELVARERARHMFYQEELQEVVEYKANFEQFATLEGVTVNWSTDEKEDWCGIVGIREVYDGSNNYEYVNAAIAYPSILLDRMRKDTCYHGQFTVVLWLKTRNILVGAHDQSLYFRWK
jgi:hypothetical protein